MKTRHADAIRCGIYMGRYYASHARNISRGHYPVRMQGTKLEWRAVVHSIGRELRGTGLLMSALPDGSLTIRSMWDGIPSTLRPTRPIPKG